MAQSACTCTAAARNGLSVATSLFIEANTIPKFLGLECRSKPSRLVKHWCQEMKKYRKDNNSNCSISDEQALLKENCWWSCSPAFVKSFSNALKHPLCIVELFRQSLQILGHGGRTPLVTPDYSRAGCSSSAYLAHTQNQVRHVRLQLSC